MNMVLVLRHPKYSATDLEGDNALGTVFMLLRAVIKWECRRKDNCSGWDGSPILCQSIPEDETQRNK